MAVFEPTTFNSLSRDHSRRWSRDRPPAGYSLSTPSLGITFAFSRNSSSFSNFQLPLSGSQRKRLPRKPSQRTFNSLSRDHAYLRRGPFTLFEVNFQLPLSGSPFTDIGCWLRDLVKLSTPSLGITGSLGEFFGKAYKRVLSTFNSLSRDHTAVGGSCHGLEG